MGSSDFLIKQKWSTRRKLVSNKDPPSLQKLCTVSHPRCACPVPSTKIVGSSHHNSRRFPIQMIPQTSLLFPMSRLPLPPVPLDRLRVLSDPPCKDRCNQCCQSTESEDPPYARVIRLPSLLLRQFEDGTRDQCRNDLWGSDGDVVETKYYTRLVFWLVLRVRAPPPRLAVSFRYLGAY